MKKKITLLDKIFSFRECVIKQYIENELSDYIHQINFKKDVIRRHWVFFLVKSFHVFIFIGFFSYLLFFLIKYQNIVHDIFKKGNISINMLIGGLSFFIIFGFILYIIKAKLINKIGIFLGFAVSLINIFLTIPEKISSNYISEALFASASILLFIFFVEIILKSTKVIYDVLIDYKNDFIVIYPEGIYISEKEGALYHSAQRIMFDEIVDVSSREKGIFGTILGFGKLKISIMGTGDDYEFRYCRNITRVPTILNEKRIKYAEFKRMKSKKDHIIQNGNSTKNEIKVLNEKCKPFKSRLRNDLIKTLNLE